MEALQVDQARRPGRGNEQALHMSVPWNLAQQSVLVVVHQ